MMLIDVQNNDIFKLFKHLGNKFYHNFLFNISTKYDKNCILTDCESQIFERPFT